MIIKIRGGTSPQALEALVGWLRAMGVGVSAIDGARQPLLCLVGDTAGIDIDSVRAQAIVEDVKRVQEPYRLASRREHPDDTIIPIGEKYIGGDAFTLIAGPCAVESEAQMLAIARAVKAAGADLLRGGAFKPRTSPYTFAGLEREGIRLLEIARAETGLPVVSEIMEAGQLPLFGPVDILQVGARNMQNYPLLRALGEQRKPVLLKRGLSSTLEEWLMSAEYILAGGNPHVILCERGIRTFETYTRNTLDLSAVPALKRLTHLPVFVDPSHGVGVASLVPSMALAATAAGAAGLMIEVHDRPAEAMSDGAQAIGPGQLRTLRQTVDRVRQAIAPQKKEERP